MKNWNESWSAWFARIGIDKEHAERLTEFIKTIISSPLMAKFNIDACQFVKQKIKEYELTYDDLATVIVIFYNFVFFIFLMQGGEE